jgi:aconitate hydratase
MEPRWLGAAAVITRSFARIHETNLKKQGVLPLTFAEAADYEKVGETDRVSLHGLRDLAPGTPLEVTFPPADGSSDTVGVRHTLNADQVAWFKAGSALNVLKDD